MTPLVESTPVIPFPSIEWFEQLANLMNTNRARQEQLGYVDCVAVFAVGDDSNGETPRHFQVRFEEFEAVGVNEISSDEVASADFSLVASNSIWSEMIRSIAEGDGQPDLDHSLNRLSHMGTPMKLNASDPLKADLYFRYNQSLQEFFDASAGFTTVFPEAI